MKTSSYKFSVLLILLIFAIVPTISGQRLESIMEDSLTAIAREHVRTDRITVRSMTVNQRNKTIIVTAHDRLSYMPFRPGNTQRIYNALSAITAERYPGYSIQCITDGQNINLLIPNKYRTSNIEHNRLFKVNAPTQPLVANLSAPYSITSGLQNRHMAVWHSHGLYYDQRNARWSWQRARLFQSVEDLLTMSFVVPYLVPMLENAGANVLLPRERDTQIHEVIVDNDNSASESVYREKNSQHAWTKGETGFANHHDFYLQGENPFRIGTFRHTTSTNNIEKTSRIEWIPDLPEDGAYAVYVSYKSLPSSTKDARYTVYHKGGTTEFSVNQTMGGSTWIYLGNFHLDKNRSNQGKVELTNYSNEAGKTVTADAVKFGGGMGNVARNPILNSSNRNTRSADPRTSGRPRFMEGARYWLQWAGVPDSIYSRTENKNDYSDDFQSRGFWVNYLAGGSSAAPRDNGLNIPLDLAVAFHTDAGVNKHDSIIGTLAICSVKNSDGKTLFKNGVSRWASRDMVDIIQTQIVDDIRNTYDPEWTRRGLWNRSYSESRNPEIPTLLLELLSHQNLADMRYGNDPRFRFLVGRSIYKGILKYIAFTNDYPYVVQPLPIEKFNIRFTGERQIQLSWDGVVDPLEPTARADKYVVYQRIDDGGFDNGTLVSDNNFQLEIRPGRIYSFKITAVNQGGESFPSEILSCYRASSSKGEVMIVNGFTRVSAPVSFSTDSTSGGFLNDFDAGVPYIRDFSFVGRQYEFDKNRPWINDEVDPGFGASERNFESMVIAGNSFDYPYLHGKAIKAAGYSFVSSSLDAATSHLVNLSDYRLVNLILGKQKQTFIGNAKKEPEFKTFPLALQHAIRAYCNNGGNILVSGAHTGSDIAENGTSRTEERQFLENVLKVRFQKTIIHPTGNIKTFGSPFFHFQHTDFDIYSEPNTDAYFLQTIDVLEPAGNGAFSISMYKDNGKSVGVASNGKYRTCVFGFPLEAITSEKSRNRLMESALDYLNANKNRIRDLNKTDK